MGGRGGSSGLGSGNSDKAISNSLPNESDFKFRSLPDLEGSPKQIDWAEKIRNRVLDDLKSYATGYQSDGRTANDIVPGKSKAEMVENIKGRMSLAKSNEDKEYQKNNMIGRYKDVAERIQRVNEVAAVKSAAWWIDYSQKYETRAGMGKDYRNRDMKRFVDGKVKIKKGFLPT